MHPKYRVCLLSSRSFPLIHPSHNPSNAQGNTHRERGEEAVYGVVERGVRQGEEAGGLFSFLGG